MSQVELAKTMPSAVDLEGMVLGAILLEKDALYEVMPILTAKSFYKEEHGIIYKAIVSLFDKSLPIDIVTVTNELKRTGNLNEFLSPYFITQLTNRVASAAHVEYHARIIKQEFIRRELIKKGAAITSQAYNDSVDIFDLLSDTEKSLSDIAGSLNSKQIQHVSTIVDAINEDRKNAKKDTVGIQSGIRELDEITGGWNKTDLIILAARPGMGKSGAAITYILNAAKSGHPVGFFSLEMSEKQVVNRMISQEAGVSITRIKRNQLSDSEKIKLEKAGIEISKFPIYVDDTPAISIMELRAKARRLRNKYGIELIVIDYLQLMTDGGKNKSRDQEIGGITKSLKGLAKEMLIPVIALSQVGREVEKKNKKHQRPALSDLRESGSIEQDSDIVIFIYRPEYYDKEACDESGNSLKGVAEKIVAKNRDGETKTAFTEFEAWTTRFLNRVVEGEPVEEDMPF